MGTDRILGTRLGTRKNNLYLIIKVYGDISRSFDLPHLHHIPKNPYFNLYINRLS